MVRTETYLPKPLTMLSTTGLCAAWVHSAAPQTPPTGHNARVAPRCSLSWRFSRRQCVAFVAAAMLRGSAHAGEESFARESNARATRTVFDEERELFERRQEQARRSREQALRAAFEAVQKASEQLDDVQKLLDDGDLLGVATFSRLFNDAVVREGMQKVASKLQDKEQRTMALQICSQSTLALKQMDGAARAARIDVILSCVEDVRALIQRFVALSPQ